MGVGVNSGVAYVGSVGSGDHADLTAMGDAVNVAARLASAAGPGEILVAPETIRLTGVSSLVTRDLRLKGKAEPITAAVFSVAEEVSSAPS